MKVGAEPKKLAILGGLVAAAGVLYYTNSAPETPASPAPRPAQPSPVTAAAVTTSARTPGLTANIRRDRRDSRGQELKWVLKARGKNAVDTTQIDPTLKLDLFDRVRTIDREEPRRSLFAVGPAPVPETPKLKIDPKKPEQIEAEQKAAAEAAKAEADKPPPPPPITLKFYGYSTPRRDGVKRAFFLDGEDIFVVTEGELIKKRYKVVRIGTNSVVMEDTEHKNQQTLILQQEQT
ncbi:MAG: hypothetical protein ACRD96_23130 [Bryobacteraceae bacterium]